MAKKKHPLVDDLGPRDFERIRTALRQVWSWSYPRRLCIARATDKKGFGWCEECKARVPKLFADHITPIGVIDREFRLTQMFRPSKFLQALCGKCHGRKTREEKKARDLKARLDEVEDF